MVGTSNSLKALKGLLTDHCGYEASLWREGYRFGRELGVDFAAFAHRPCDARSVCIAGFQSDASDIRAQVLQRRELGAPVLFVEHSSGVDVWRPGADGADCVRRELSHESLQVFVEEHSHQLGPRVLYDAKTRGRLPEGKRQLKLFVDPGLLPYAEGEVGRRLTQGVVQAVDTLSQSLASVSSPQFQTWVFKATFRLLAAKILKDKRVSGFISLRPTHVQEALHRVEKHYGSQDPLAISSRDREQALEAAADVFQQLGDLRNLTTEALADVYEQALITKATRKAHGTHKTPAYLVDYIVWQLADWIEQIPPAQIRVFEPACGHSPFLVGAMRLLRSLDLDVPDFSQFFRERFEGIDNDPFALEIARLSLTVADEPNPNGWNGLQTGDMFAGQRLEEMAARCTILLSNPPFEGGKAVELLERTIPHLQPGAVFGVIVPATFLFSSDKKAPQRVRKWLLEHCQVGEVALFPDRIFKFADQECTIITGRRMSENRQMSYRTRLRRVRESDREPFQHDYRFTTSRICPQSRFASEPDLRLWVADSDEEIWSWLDHLPKLETIAEVNKGLEHKGREALESAITVQEQPFPGSVEGFDSSEGDWYIHEHPPIRHFNLDPDLIRRPGSGTDRVPQVLLNYAPVGRGRWRIKPFIDETGRAFSSRFVSVRPKNASLPLEFLWAICCSPIAQLFVYDNMLKREVRIGTFRQLPLFKHNPSDVIRVASLARQYLDGARRGRLDLLTPRGYSERELDLRLCRLDAEVLRLYDLPARAERLLLDQFAGEERPGLPFDFSRYYPEGFDADVPLYAFLSDSFQCWLDGRSPELDAAQQARYETLVEKSEFGRFNDRETEELHHLQAEVDGRDFALQQPKNTWRQEQERSGNKSEAVLRLLDDRVEDLTARVGRKS